MDEMPRKPGPMVRKTTIWLDQAAIDDLDWLVIDTQNRSHGDIIRRLIRAERIRREMQKRTLLHDEEQ